MRSLEEIGTYIAAHDPSAAAQLVTKIARTAETLLPDNPFAGRPAVFHTRELVVHKNYILSYRVTPTAIEVLAIRHVAQRTG